MSSDTTAVLIKNYTTPGGVGGRRILFVKDPSQRRSRFAAFDPGRIDGPDLLAGVAPLALLPAGAGIVSEDEPDGMPRHAPSSP